MLVKKTVPASILKAVEKTQNLVEQANKLDVTGITYAGGTFPYYVEVDSIHINGKFVTIYWNKQPLNYSSKPERFNTRRVSIGGDENCAKHLTYTLSIINRALKQAIASSRL